MLPEPIDSSMVPLSNRELRLMIKSVREVLWWLESQTKSTININISTANRLVDIIQMPRGLRQSRKAMNICTHEIRYTDAVLHSDSLQILQTILLERGLLVDKTIQNRQGKRGRRSAQNYMMRKTWWWIEQWLDAKARAECAERFATISQGEWIGDDPRYTHWIDRQRKRIRHVLSCQTLDRDRNATLNIKRLGMSLTATKVASKAIE